MDKGYNISSKELFVLTFFLNIGFIFTNGFKTIFNISGIGTWISILLGIMLSFINVVIIIWLKNKKINFIFKYIFITPYLLYSIYNITRFIQITYLPDFNFFIILLTILCTLIYIIKKGIETISRSSLIFFLIIIFLFLFNNISLTTSINIDYLKPIRSYSIIKIAYGSLYYFITTLPIYYLLFFPKNIIIDKINYNKSIINGYLISSLFVFITYFISESVMGINLIHYFDYPFYIVIRNINYLNLFERLENIISFMYLFIMFYYITISSYILEKK